MFLLCRPSDDVIATFIADQTPLEYTYPGVHGTATRVVPAGYRADHSRFLLGHGEAVFAQARTALKHWKQFDLGWSRVCPADTPIVAGRTVAVEFHLLGIWCLCSARIVYTIDEPRRFGFAYGTLSGHVESGEERFLVEKEHDDSVHYDIRAFSRPRHVLTKLGYPYVRYLQKQFVRASGARMRQAAQARGVEPLIER